MSKSRKDFIKFVRGLEKHILKEFSDLISESEAEEQAVITTHLETNFYGELEKDRIGAEIHLRYPRIFSERVAIKYATLSWFLPPMTQFEIQEVLRAKSSQNHWLAVESYLYSKDICYMTLFLETDLKQSDLFGNLLQRGVQEYVTQPDGKKVRVRQRDKCSIFVSYLRKPKRIVRRRGYNDHGSTRPSHERRELPGDFLSSKQFRLELLRLDERIISQNRLLDVIREFKMLR